MPMIIPASNSGEKMAAEKAANIAALMAVELATAKIHAEIGTGGSIAGWSINGLPVSHNLSAPTGELQQALLSHCREWAKTHPQQFLANCLSVPYADSYYAPRIRRAVKRWLG